MLSDLPSTDKWTVRGDRELGLSSFPGLQCGPWTAWLSGENGDPNFPFPKAFPSLAKPHFRTDILVASFFELQCFWGWTT